MRELTVENYLVRKVQKAGGDVRKVAWLGRRHAPDRAVLWPRQGLHDLVEMKAPGKKPPAGQLREHERLWRAGFSVLVLDTHEKIDAYIRRRAA